MKRVVVNHFGGPEVLRVVEDGVPQPGPGCRGERGSRFPCLEVPAESSAAKGKLVLVP